MGNGEGARELGKAYDFRHKSYSVLDCDQVDCILDQSTPIHCVQFLFYCLPISDGCFVCFLLLLL